MGKRLYQGFTFGYPSEIGLRQVFRTEFAVMDQADGLHCRQGSQIVREAHLRCPFLILDWWLRNQTMSSPIWQRWHGTAWDGHDGGLSPKVPSYLERTQNKPAGT